MSQSSTHEHFVLATQHHQAGRVAEAERIYRQILAGEAEHPGALHYLGVIEAQRSETDLAMDLLRRAVIAKPDYADAHAHLANVLATKKLFDEAIASFRLAIALTPNYPTAYNNLGNALKDSGRDDEAIAAYRQALAQRGDLLYSHLNVGALLAKKGHWDEAMAHYRRAIALKPDCGEAYNNLGNILKDLERYDEAIVNYNRTLELIPDCSQAYNNLACALKEKGRVDEAIAAFRKAIELRPELPELHNNLSTGLLVRGEFEEALACCRKAVEMRSDYADAYTNLGNALKGSGLNDEAVAAYRKGIEYKPDGVLAHWNLAILLLSMGQFADGWDEFEWRLRKGLTGLARNFAPPQWNGEDLAGKTLLLHAEGGLGDALHFIRYVPLLRGRAARLVLECQPGLMSLLRDVAGIDEIFARGQTLPPFDYHSPLQSLPRQFKTDMTNIPAQAPYLKVPEKYQERWKGRIPKDGRRHVGLVWAGSVRTGPVPDERTRDLNTFVPLAQVPGVQFYSLQKGPEADLPRPAGLELIDYTREFNDFADTAALVEQLDLVISVDTSVVHLAGALGKPVWVMIPYFADFRWLLEREDSPWYPTMRLFRQVAYNDWTGVMPRIAEALRAFCNEK